MNIKFIQILAVILLYASNNNIIAAPINMQIHPDLVIRIENPNPIGGFIRLFRDSMTLGVDLFYRIFNLPEGVDKPDINKILPK